MGNDSVGVTMPDTSVFGALLRGDRKVAQELQQLIASGEKIVVPWSVYSQIQNTPNSASKAVQLLLIKELGLTVQDPTSLKQRNDVYSEAAANLKLSHKASAGIGNVAADDLPVIADVRIYSQGVHGITKAVKLWTVEKLATNSGVQKQYKIIFSPLTRKLSLGKFAKAEDVLAMFPSLKARYKVTADGRFARRIIGPGMRMAGLAIGHGAVAFVLAFVVGKILQRQIEADLKKSLEALVTMQEPAVRRDFNHHKETVLRLLADGKRAYATISYKVAGGIAMFMVEPGWADSAPSNEYIGLRIVDAPILAVPDPRSGLWWRHVAYDRGGDMIAPGAMTTPSDSYEVSVPVTAAPEEIEMYRWYRKEIEWYRKLSESEGSKQYINTYAAKGFMLFEELQKALAEVEVGPN